MRIIVKDSIAYSELKRYLPKKYFGLIPAKAEGKYVNIVMFPHDSKKVITSKYIEKALCRINDKTMQSLFFTSSRFTLEAIELIIENNGIALSGWDNFLWTDESYANSRN